MRARVTVDDSSWGTLIHSKGSRTEFKTEAKTSEYKHGGERERDSSKVVMLEGTVTDRPKLGCCWFSHSSVSGD